MMHPMCRTRAQGGYGTRDSRWPIQRTCLSIPVSAAAAFVIALACLLVPASGFAESPRRVGVVITLTVNVTEERALDISGALGEAMSQELAVSAIAGAEAAAALPKAGIQDGCIADDECIRELADRLEVDEILAVVLVEVGEQIKIESTWIDVEEGRRVSRAALAFEKGGAPAELFRRRAHELLPGADRHPDSADEPEDEEGADAEQADGAAADAAANAREDEGTSAEPRDGDLALRRAGRERHMTPAAWTATGIGGAALSGGIAFWLATRSLHQSCDDRENCDDGDGTRITRRALAADALFATAAVSGGVAALLYWWSDSDPEREVSVGTGPGDVGLSLGGRF